METKKRLKKIPEGCIEIPLEKVDYMYQPPQSHTPVVVMKQNKNKLDRPRGQSELRCMKCGSKENLNTNKDKSFVECDECMWDLKSKPEKQEEWREKIKQMVLTDCFKDQPDIQRYIDFIEQLLSESKEKAKIEVLEKVLEKKTNYEIEREEHGYRVTLEYVLADDIKKEIKLLKEGDDLQE